MYIYNLLCIQCFDVLGKKLLTHIVTVRAFWFWHAILKATSSVMCQAI